MKDLLPIIDNWSKSLTPFSIATVIQTWGSSPRPVGSTMIINSEGEMAGSVSGGCVEGAVVKESQALNKEGGGKRLHYGVTDDNAWAVGLSCGGRLQVYTERFLAFDERDEERQVWAILQRCLRDNTSCVLVTSLVDGVNTHSLVKPDGSVIGHEIDQSVVQASLQAYQRRKHEVFEHGDTAYFLQVFARRSQMLIIGAAHVTTHLVDLAAMFDFESIVIDPRGAFAERTQFNTPPDRIVQEYPSEVLSEYNLDPYTYAVILSHDPKIDDNALQVLLPSQVAYIGALGSKKTHAKRVLRLEGHGFSSEEISRIHAPIGVSMNALRPKEIALSIMAQIIHVKNEFGR